MEDNSPFIYINTVMKNWYRELLEKLMESDFDSRQNLANRIESFLNSHAVVAASYDPEYDDPEERWSSPDAAMMMVAAQNIRNGDPIIKVHSTWGSGGYKPYGDVEARKEHDMLLAEIYELINK